MEGSGLVKRLIRIAQDDWFVKRKFLIFYDGKRSHFQSALAYTYMYVTQEGGTPRMRIHDENETASRTEPKGDVDDLIFRSGPGWSASDR